MGVVACRCWIWRTLPCCHGGGGCQTLSLAAEVSGLRLSLLAPARALPLQTPHYKHPIVQSEGGDRPGDVELGAVGDISAEA